MRKPRAVIGMGVTACLNELPPSARGPSSPPVGPPEHTIPARPPSGRTVPGKQRGELGESQSGSFHPRIRPDSLSITSQPSTWPNGNEMTI